MRKLRNNNKSTKHHTRKEYGLKMDLGDEIDEKFHKFTILFRKNKNHNKDEEFKNKNNSFSSDEDNNEYYENFLKKLEKNNIENNNNEIKENNLKKQKRKIQKSSLLSNKKYRNLLKQSLMKNHPIKNNHLSLTPINEEKLAHENLNVRSLKPHHYNISKYYSHKMNNSNEIHNSLFQSRVNSNKSKENLNDKNSYILNDIKNDHSLILGNLHIKNPKNSFTPQYNQHNKTNFSSIKTRKSPFKIYDSSFVLGIKNSKTDNLKKKIPFKEEEKQINNSLEEASGINFKPNYNFNPKKIEVKNITSNNNQININNDNQNEKIIEKELKNNENNQTQNESYMKIEKKKKCLFCCLPIY
jgi:hypothetical protein